MPAGNLVEISYDALTADAVGTLRGVYDALGVPGFDANLRPAVESEVARLRGYKTNTHAPLPPALREVVARRWEAYSKAWGYEWGGK